MGAELSVGDEAIRKSNAIFRRHSEADIDVTSQLEKAHKLKLIARAASERTFNLRVHPCIQV